MAQKKEIHCPSNFSSPFQPMSFFLPSKLMSVQQQFVALSFTVDVLEKCLLLLHPLLHVTAMMPPAALAQRLSPGGCIKGRKTPRAPQTMQAGGGREAEVGYERQEGSSVESASILRVFPRNSVISHIYKSFFAECQGVKRAPSRSVDFYVVVHWRSDRGNLAKPNFFFHSYSSSSKGLFCPRPFPPFGTERRRV